MKFKICETREYHVVRVFDDETAADFWARTNIDQYGKLVCIFTDDEDQNTSYSGSFPNKVYRRLSRRARSEMGDIVTDTISRKIHPLTISKQVQDLVNARKNRSCR